MDKTHFDQPVAGVKGKASHGGKTVRGARAAPSLDVRAIREGEHQPIPVRQTDRRESAHAAKSGEQHHYSPDWSGAGVEDCGE